MKIDLKFAFSIEGRHVMFVIQYKNKLCEIWRKIRKKKIIFLGKTPSWICYMFMDKDMQILWDSTTEPI